MINGETDRKETAVLIFARSARLDLARRGWPKAWAGLLRTPLLECRFEEADVHLFTSSDEAATLRRQAGLVCHLQRSGSFSRRLNSAVEEISAEGYSRIVIVGRDCPDLSAADVRRAIRDLSDSRLVLGPDHKGGVYLIGLHSDERRLLERVKWHRNTDCRQLLQLFGPESVVLLPVKQDLDDLDDLRLFASSGSPGSGRALLALNCLLPKPFWRRAVPPPRECDFQRTAWQIPPPLR